MYTAPSRWPCGLRRRLQLLDCWDCVFESRRWNPRYRLEVVCCDGSGLWDWRITGTEDCYRMFLCVRVCVLCACVREREGDFGIWIEISVPAAVSDNYIKHLFVHAQWFPAPVNNSHVACTAVGSIWCKVKQLNAQCNFITFTVQFVIHGKTFRQFYSVQYSAECRQKNGAAVIITEI